MASTNKTTNYELSQFVETDRPAWLTDYNGDMRTIDSTMKAISDVASGASGSISELADRMSTAEGNITTNTNDIAALDARADALEAGAQSQAGTIANIQTEQTAQNLGIEAATELGYNLARPYDSASTYAVGDYVLFQNTLYKCVTAVPVGEVFVPAKWLAIKVMDEVGTGGAANATYTRLPDITFGAPTEYSNKITFNGTNVIRGWHYIKLGNLNIMNIHATLSNNHFATSGDNFAIIIPITSWGAVTPFREINQNYDATAFSYNCGGNSEKFYIEDAYLNFSSSAQEYVGFTIRANTGTTVTSGDSISSVCKMLFVWTNS